MKVDFESLFRSLSFCDIGTQKRIEVDSSLGVFYGLSGDGNFRLAFFSSVKAPRIESTKSISVSQGEESTNVHWTCFDLTSEEASAAFFAFCQNMIEAIENNTNEHDALELLRRRYICWKNLFKDEKKPHVSKEVLQGLFGEMYFLYEYMLSKYGPKESIIGWGGPDNTSKDFVVNSDWFEIKTVGSTVPCVKISSVTQLSSNVPGHLVIVRVEQMPTAYNSPCSSIIELLSKILALVKDEVLENTLINKVSNYGIDINNEEIGQKFDVKSMDLYYVDDDFPRITIEKIPYQEINNVSYEISIAGIHRFKEDNK